MIKEFTLAEIQNECKKLAKKHWGLSITIPIRMNNRLSTRLGTMKYRTMYGVNYPIVIEFAGYLKNYNLSTIQTVLLHELTHYAMMTKGLPYKDSDTQFKRECVRVGGSLTRTIGAVGFVHQYKCCGCGKDITLKERKHKNVQKNICGYASTCCGERFEYVGKIYKKDDYTI